MFNQSHQRIKVTKSRVYKFYSNLEQLQKSICINKLIGPLLISAKVLKIREKQKYIIQEKLNLPKLSNGNISNEEIIKIAVIMKKLHSIVIDLSIQSILLDDFTKGNLYRPLKIYDSIYSNISRENSMKYRKYRKTAVDLENFFSNQKKVLSLIHGDINSGNIMQKGDELRFIDWDDSRIDHPVVDVYIFFHNFNLNKVQEQLFWSIYKKPTYWSNKLDTFFKIVQEMYDLTEEHITIIVPTYNRCPFKKLSFNPLYTTISSLVKNNPLIVNNIIIGDDNSSDYTFDTYLLLKKKFKNINFTYFKNAVRLKASATRRKTIENCPTQLFIMTDDDCIFPANFITNSYKLFKKIRSADRNIAVLNFPYVNKRFEFNGSIEESKFGKVDLKKHWFHHNFDKLPIGIKAEYLKVDTFEGIFLGVKNHIVSAGNYENLTDFVVDYAEHVSMSWRLSNKGFTFYHALGLQYLVNHLKFGDHDNSVNITSFPKEYQSILKRSNKQLTNSGDRVSKLKTLESFISSFIYFYFCISKKEGKKHIKKEFDYLHESNNLNEFTLESYRNGVITALKVLMKKGIINDQDQYLDYMDKNCISGKKFIYIQLNKSE